MTVFMDNPEPSRRLAGALHTASMTGMITPEQRIKAARAAARATSWEKLPKWLRELVDEVESL